jgi:hypothetical protein
MANTAGPAVFPGGMPQADPIYLVDANGNPISASNPLQVSATLTPVANQRVNAQSGDFVAGSIADLATLLTDLVAVITANKVQVNGTVTEASAAAIKSDLDEIATDTDNLATLVTNTTGLATSANQSTANTSLSGIKSDLDTLVTNTADLLADGDNLTTIATNTTGLATQTTVASMLTALNTLVTDNADLLADGDNLATILTALQGVLQVKRAAVAVYSLASTQSSGATQNSGDLTVGLYTEIGIDINTTAQSGTNPTLQLFYERKGADGIYYVLWQSAVLSAAANTISTSIGAGMAYNQSLGLTGRLRWVVGGTSTPTYTFSAQIYGK